MDSLIVHTFMYKIIATILILILIGILIYKKVDFQWDKSPIVVQEEVEKSIKKPVKKSPIVKLEPKKSFILTYACPQRTKKFKTKEEADAFVKSLKELGFQTRQIRRRGFPDDGSNFRRRGFVFWVYYGTQSKTKKFDNLDSAHQLETKLKGWGCVVKVEKA